MIEFIIRDFNESGLHSHEEVLKALADEVLANYPHSSFDLKISEQYRNMKNVLDHHPQVTAHGIKAIQRAGLTVKKESIRGGTDGSRFSYIGMPCPNIFTGEMALHGKHEYVSVQDMQKSMQTLVHLVQVWESSS